MTTIEIKPRRCTPYKLQALALWVALKLMDAEYRLVIDGQAGKWVRPRRIWGTGHTHANGR